MVRKSNMNGRREDELKYEEKIKKLISDYMKKTNDRTINGFYLHIKKSGKTESYRTHHLYVRFVIQFMLHVNEKKVNLKKIDVDFINEYLDDISTKEDGTKKSQSYMTTAYASIKKLFSYLKATGKISQDVMLDVDRPADEKEANLQERRVCLTKEEMIEYFNCVKEGAGSDRAIAKQKKWRKRDIAIIGLFLTTGMRCSQLEQINLEDLDFENDTIKTVKKGGESKVYALSDGALRMVLEWLNDRKKLLKGKSCNALFISDRRSRMSNATIAHVVKKYSSTIQGKEVSPHKLRATYGTLIYEETHDIYFTQQCLGHARFDTTKIYIRNQSNQTKEASSVMTSSLGL